MASHIYSKSNNVLSLACLWVGMLRMFEYVSYHFSKSRVGMISVLSPIAVWENLFGNWD